MTRNYFRLFYKRIVKDLKHKQLLPIKFVFFVQTSTILVLYPYLTIHMRELGINVEETAIMSAVTPVIGILMPPIAGIIADKIGNFKIILAMFSFMGGVSALLLLLVPVGRVTITFPKEVVLGVSCVPDSSLSLTLYEDFPCIPSNLTSANLTIQSCGVVCNAAQFDNQTYETTILRSPSYDLNFHNMHASKTEVFTHTLSPEDYTEKIVNTDSRNHQLLQNNLRFKTAIRKISKNAYFFPASNLFNFTCGEVKRTKEEYGCVYGKLENIHEFDEIRNFFDINFNLKKETKEDEIDERKSYSVKSVKVSRLGEMKSSCYSGWPSVNHVSVSLPPNDNTTSLELGSCGLRCIATSSRKNFCSNDHKVIEYDVTLTFWSYLGIRVFIGIIGGTAYTMFEGAVIACLREYKADYGLQRVYAAIGGMISSPLSGWMIDFFSEGKGYRDFRPVFYLYAILKSLSAVLMLFINLEFKSPAVSVIRDVLSLMNIELISLFVACFLLGSAWGYIESFLFWLIQDLGGSQSLMGLTITVGGILGIPLLVLSGPMIKKVGHANVIFVGFIAYAIRLMGYSVIYNPWHSLFFEALECFTHSLCFTAAITYAARLSTPTTDTTIQGIFGGLFYGVGRSFGSLVGGYLIKYYGIRGTFQIFSIATGVVGIVYLIFYHVYMKNRSALNKKDEEEKKDVEKTNNQIQDGDSNVHNKEVPVPLPYEEAVTNLGFEENEQPAEEFELNTNKTENNTTQ